MENSVTTRVLDLLLSGSEITPKQLAARFSVANPRDIVRSIRRAGYPVNLVERQDTKGRVTRWYSMVDASPSVTSYAVGR
jgi:hypothetical protein